MTEYEKLFGRNPQPPKSIIDLLTNHDDIIDVTVWYDYKPGHRIGWKGVLAVTVVAVIVMLIRKRIA